MEVRKIFELNNYCDSQNLEVKADLTTEVKKKF